MLMLYIIDAYDQIWETKRMTEEATAAVPKGITRKVRVELLAFSEESALTAAAALIRRQKYDVKYILMQPAKGQGVLEDLRDSVVEIAEQRRSED